MKKSFQFGILIIIVIVIHVFVPVASAHPLGNFTINHYAGLQVSRQAIHVDYVMDMAEIPAFQEISILDANHNGQPDSQEVSAYPPTKCEEVRSGLSLSIDGRQIPLSLTSSAVAFPPGQGGLSTLRLTCAFRATLSGSGQVRTVEFGNRLYPERIGWREIVVNADGVSLHGDFAETSVSSRLTKYPKDMLASPLNQRQVAFEVDPAGAASPPAAPSLAQQARPLPVDRNDAFTRLILLEDVTLPTLLLALAISFVWGGMHALTPGHGKTIVGAYLVGSRGTAKHALYLGLATTITHTAGVFALGLVTMFAARFILPEKLFPWLSFVSGLLVVGIGMKLFVRRLGASGLSLAALRKPTFSSSSLPKNAVSAAVRVPHPLQELSYSHIHSYEPSRLQHHPRQSPLLLHEHSHPHDEGHTHPYSHNPGHTHAGHSHLPPGADGSPVTARSLLALGISGGLLPCPSALVVLLSAIALHKVGFGLALVLAFSLGLAGVLTGIGLVFVYAGRIFERTPLQFRALRILPAFSALFIAVIGLSIAVKALIDMGLIKL